MHGVRRIERKLKRDQTAARVSHDVCTSHAKMHQQCPCVRRGAIDIIGRRPFRGRAAGISAAEVSDQAVIRQRDLIHKREDISGRNVSAM